MTKMKEFLVRLGKRQMRRLLIFRIIFIVLLFLFEIILFPHQVFNLGVIAVYLLTITTSLADKLSRSSRSYCYSLTPVPILPHKWGDWEAEVRVKIMKRKTD